MSGSRQPTTDDRFGVTGATTAMLVDQPVVVRMSGPDPIVDRPLGLAGPELDRWPDQRVVRIDLAEPATVEGGVPATGKAQPDRGRERPAPDADPADPASGRPAEDAERQ